MPSRCLRRLNVPMVPHSCNIYEYFIGKLVEVKFYSSYCKYWPGISMGSVSIPIVKVCTYNSLRVSLFSGLEWTTGPLVQEWTSYWNTGKDYWNTRMDYWNGYLSHKMLVRGEVTWFCNYSDEILIYPAMCILSLQCTLHSGLLPIL